MQNRKIRDKVTGVENARPENKKKQKMQERKMKDLAGSGK